MKLRSTLPLIFSILLLLGISSSTLLNAEISSIENNSVINVYPPDNYADEVISWASLFIADGDNALGAPDGVYATVYQGYAPGVLTLDLGKYETAADDTGDDLTVYITSGDYLVKLGNDLAQPFTSLGTSNETASFDFGSIGFDAVRYVQIQCNSVDVVLLDAIEIVNLVTVADEDVDPEITGYDGLVNKIWVTTTEIEFSWLVSDATPWNYSITVNDTEYEKGEWESNTIDFYWDEIEIGNLTIILRLWDYFGNYAEDVIIIEIEPAPSNSNYFAFISVLPLVLMAFTKRRKKK